SLPQGNTGLTGLCDSAHKFVAGLPAIAVGQSKKAVDVPTESLASQLPQGSGWNEHYWSPPIPVGASLLAKAVCQLL
ncbi:hypothetical protein, partial [Pseudomonas fluorescens]|uniref:hypothetical protein n=1 Tax=Pseudomonas fluorescens TaxID=294 RepID=UPI001F2710E2